MGNMYCLLSELLEDLGLNGSKHEAGLMRHIRAASQYIEREIGMFIPRVETLKFCGDGYSSPAELLVPPLLAITSITNDGTALTAGVDYILSPGRRHWVNGPYSRLIHLCGAWSSVEQGVVIAGEWGFYNYTKDLDVTISSANATDTSLAVGDGSKCSPGMVLLVDSEQMLVDGTGAASDSTATLAAGVDADAEEISVDSGTKLASGEVIQVGFEQMKVLEIQTNTVLVERGWNESRRAAHLISAAVMVFRTFSVERGVNGTTAAAHTNAAAYQYQAPEDVNYLCRQIAALMLKKAQTGFVGRSGNDDLGTGFWVNEFPKNQIEAVMANYFWGGR